MLVLLILFFFSFFCIGNWLKKVQMLKNEVFFFACDIGDGFELGPKSYVD